MHVIQLKLKLEVDMRNGFGPGAMKQIIKLLVDANTGYSREWQIDDVYDFGYEVVDNGLNFYVKMNKIVVGEKLVPNGRFSFDQNSGASPAEFKAAVKLFIERYAGQLKDELPNAAEYDGHKYNVGFIVDKDKKIYVYATQDGVVLIKRVVLDRWTNPDQNGVDGFVARILAKLNIQ